MDDRPYAVIDSGAPRTLQAIVGILVLVAFATDASWILVAIAAVVYLGVWLGRDYVPAYAVYFRLVEPRTGGAAIEDERAPRFAQIMGASGLVTGWVLIMAGLPTAGWTVAVLLAVAAIFAAATGICLGCLTYRGLARLRGIVPGRIDRIAPEDVVFPASPGGGGEGLLVGFTHPLCSACKDWETRLADDGRPFVLVDVRERPAIARKYRIALLPTVYEVARDGRVLGQLAP